MTANFHAVQSGSFNASGGTFTSNVTQAGSSNMMLVVGVGYIYAGSGLDDVVCRYGNSNLTQATNQGSPVNPANGHLFYLYGPRTDATNLVVSNLEQANEVGAWGAVWVTNAATNLGNAIGTNAGSATSAETNIIASAGSLIVDGWTCANGTNATTGVGQTSRASNVNGNTQFAMSTKDGDGNTTNMSWSWASAQNSGLCVVEVEGLAAAAADVDIVGMG